MLELVLVLIGVVGGAAVSVLILRRFGRSAPVAEIRTDTVAERVRAVGKLVGLEVHAKEIATSTKGWSWIPPILLSQAKIAMIFNFEKQYHVDLARVRGSDIREESPGVYRVSLPEIEGTLRLVDVTPYDVQAGRILGLLDVIQMDAPTQGKLMATAREQAARLFEQNEARYAGEARRSIERQMESLLRMFDLTARVVWPDGETRDVPEPRGLLVEVGG